MQVRDRSGHLKRRNDFFPGPDRPQAHWRVLASAEHTIRTCRGAAIACKSAPAPEELTPRRMLMTMTSQTTHNNRSTWIGP